MTVAISCPHELLDGFRRSMPSHLTAGVRLISGTSSLPSLSALVGSRHWLLSRFHGARILSTSTRMMFGGDTSPDPILVQFSLEWGESPEESSRALGITPLEGITQCSAGLGATDTTGAPCPLDAPASFFQHAVKSMTAQQIELRRLPIPPGREGWLGPGRRYRFWSRRRGHLRLWRRLLRRGIYHQVRRGRDTCHGQ